MRSVVTSLVALAAVAVLESKADPILPYQQPIEQKLTNDIAGGSPDTRTLEKALNKYNSTSKSLRGDTSILRSLNNYLDEIEGYETLLAQAALDYQADFQGRRDALYAQLVPAPISANKTSARTALRRVDTSLSNAVNAATSTDRIRQLHTAAQRLASASNSVQRALRTSPGVSKMVAKVGVLSFNSDKGRITGNGDFSGDEGSAIGAFSENGVLSVSAIDSGSVVRGLHLHIEGVSRSYPAVYQLGGDNRAFYDAYDARRRQEFHFRSLPGVTNSTVTNSFVSIDYIGTNSLTIIKTDTNSVKSTNVFYTTGYILGRFSFVGTNLYTFTSNTNTSVNVTAGEFQLNFEISSDAEGNPVGGE